MLYQPRSVTVVRFVMIVTSNGTISVARNTTNSVRFNGNSRNANAYPARIAVDDLARR